MLYHCCTLVQTVVMVSTVFIRNRHFWTTINLKFVNWLSPIFAQMITLVSFGYIPHCPSHTREIMGLRNFRKAVWNWKFRNRSKGQIDLWVLCPEWIAVATDSSFNMHRPCCWVDEFGNLIFKIGHFSCITIRLTITVHDKLGLNCTINKKHSYTAYLSTNIWVSKKRAKQLFFQILRWRKTKIV